MNMNPSQETFSDVGKAAGSRNKCLMCDQPVKIMERESPAQLPELPHTNPLLHLVSSPKQLTKPKVFKPDARHDDSPPRYLLQ